jgi:hypothetical protein
MRVKKDPTRRTMGKNQKQKTKNVTVLLREQRKKNITVTFFVSKKNTLLFRGPVYLNRVIRMGCNFAMSKVMKEVETFGGDK